MRKQEPLQLNWRDAALGILTEAAYVGALCGVAWLVAVIVDWGGR